MLVPSASWLVRHGTALWWCPGAVTLSLWHHLNIKLGISKLGGNKKKRRKLRLQLLADWRYLRGIQLLGSIKFPDHKDAVSTDTFVPNSTAKLIVVLWDQAGYKISEDLSVFVTGYRVWHCRGGFKWEKGIIIFVCFLKTLFILFYFSLFYFLLFNFILFYYIHLPVWVLLLRHTESNQWCSAV